ncbi:MAG: phosphatase [Legionella sp.]
MQRILLGLLIIISSYTKADTIDHYMNIANSIPQMEIKADPQSQAWARSARNILILTSESIAESLVLANQTATTQGKPLFCLPANKELNATIVNDLIQQTYKEMITQQKNKDTMTVSEIALQGLTKTYPCSQQATDNLRASQESN